MEEGDVPDVVFAQTVYHYNNRGQECCKAARHSRSYDDFWSLVRLSGYPVCSIEEIDLTQPKAYVIVPPNDEITEAVQRMHARAGEREKRARLIAWDLETMFEEGRDSHDRLGQVVPIVDEMWVPDKLYADTLDHPKVRFVPIGSHPGLVDGELVEAKHRYDGIHLSCGSDHRRRYLQPMGQSRKIRMAPNGWDQHRHRALLTSAFMVNVHQWPVSSYAPLRFALAAAYRMPVFSEHVHDSWVLTPGVDYIDCSTVDLLTRFESLAEMARENYAEVFGEMGRRLHQKLCLDYPFRRQVEEALRD